MRKGLLNRGGRGSDTKASSNTLLVYNKYCIELSTRLLSKNYLSTYIVASCQRE